MFLPSGTMRPIGHESGAAYREQPPVAYGFRCVNRRERARQRIQARRRKRALLSIVVGGVLVAVVVLVGLAVLSAGDTGTGETDPEAWDLPGMGPNEGERVTLAAFEGRPTVVNFFASWCTVCDRELPGFRRVSQDLRGRVNFVGVASLETGDPLLMPERHGVTFWPLARDVGGRNGSGLHDALGGRGMPVTAFYDAGGNLVHFAGGELTEQQLRDQIEALYGIEAAPDAA